MSEFFRTPLVRHWIFKSSANPRIPSFPPRALPSRFDPRLAISLNNPLLSTLATSKALRILILGSGGREHAFAWKLAQSKRCAQLFIGPGNAGTSAHGQNVPLNPLDFPAVEKFVLENQIDLVVVGPEEPLVKGIYDFFKNLVSYFYSNPSLYIFYLYLRLFSRYFDRWRIFKSLLRSSFSL